MDTPRPILPAELEFFNKGTGKGKPNSYLIFSLVILGTLFTLDYCYLLSLGQPVTNWPANINTSFAVPLVVIFIKFDGQIASEFVNLTGAKDEDRWKKAREIAEITFQKVYLPKVLDTKYPPKAYVRLEGENDEDSFLK